MGYVYVIRAGNTNYHKVGISIHYPDKRLTELQTGNHLPLQLMNVFETTAYESVETLLHHALSEYHTIGEWFDVDYAIIENKVKDLRTFLSGHEDVTNDFGESLVEEVMLNPRLTCRCGLEFKTRSGLGKHKKTCETYS